MQQSTGETKNQSFDAAYNPAKLLLPWLEEDEAITCLLGQQLRTEINASQAKELWRKQCQYLSAQPAYNLPTPSLLPMPESIKALEQTFKNQPDVINAFAQFQSWEVGVVDLNQILSFQKCVGLDPDERVSDIGQDDWQKLFSLCLPEKISAPIEYNVAGDSFTFVSSNPNLRRFGTGTADISAQMKSSPDNSDMKIYGFAVGLNASFVQITEYRGRWLLRDGYHRCYGLIKKGVTKIPAILIKARNFQEVGASAPGFIREDLLFGEHPPFVADFLNDQISAEIQQRARKKVIRITIEEFSIPA